MADLKYRTLPLYAQIAASVRNEIADCIWQVGSSVPPIQNLASRFGVAPQTIRQALGLLEDEGLVQRRQGIGTIVKAEPKERHWFHLPTDWGSLVSLLDGMDPRVLLVEASDRQPILKLQDGLPAPAYKYMKRVHYRKDTPFCVIELYLDAELYLKSPREFQERMVVSVLARTDSLEIGKVTQSLDIDVASNETARLLDVAVAHPVAKVRRVITNAVGTVVYAADALYRSDVVHLELDLSPKKDRA